MVLKSKSDRWLAAYWIILLQGLASALPWNVFITETEFFALRVHQPPYTPVLAQNFETINLLTSMAGNMLGFLLYMPLHHAMSLDVQVLWPQIVTLGIMGASVVLTLKDSVSGNAFMAVILSSQVVLGITNATIAGGVYHMASWLPASYIQGMSLGIGLSGTAVSAISFLTLWAVPRGPGPPSPTQVAPAAFAYFLGSAGIVLLAIVTYYMFFYLPFVHDHSIPEVMAEWAGEGRAGEGKELVVEPPNLRRESATFLRCKTRRTSADSLSASLSRSMSDLERPLLLDPSNGFLLTRSTPQPRVPWSRSLQVCEDSPLALEEEDLELPASAPATAAWFPLADSDEDDAELPDSAGEQQQAACVEEQQPELAAAPPLTVGASLLPSLFVPEAPHCTVCSNHPTGSIRLDCGLPHCGRHCVDVISSSSASAASSSSMMAGTDSSRLLCLKPADAADSDAVLTLAHQGDGDPDLSLMQVVNKLWMYNLVAGLGCVITMATFPGITSAICSEHNDATVAPCSPTTRHGRFFGDLFVPFMFLVCNASDLCGRLVAGVGPWSITPPPMLLLVVYSLLRIPLSLPLLFCNITTPSPWILPVLFRSDLWPLGTAGLLGFTNGHLQSLALMHAPSVLPKSARDRTGPIINTALAIGTTGGSVLSFLLTYYLQRS